MPGPEVEIDITDFLINLKKIDSLSDPILTTSMEIAQNVVRDHAMANHKKAPPPGMGHPDERYYDRTARLTNSIRAEKVIIEREVLKGSIVAGTPGLVEYAAAVEFGTPRSRAYPFMQPALTENEKRIIFILNEGAKKVIGA